MKMLLDGTAIMCVFFGHTFDTSKPTRLVYTYPHGYCTRCRKYRAF